MAENRSDNSPAPLTTDRRTLGGTPPGNAKVAGFGCLWLFGTAITSSVLLILNAVVFVSLYFGIVNQLPESETGIRSWLENPGFSQLFMFLGPVTLLVLQWTLIDALREYLSHHRTEAEI